jgi:hypothetical protein
MSVTEVVVLVLIVAIPVALILLGVKVFSARK